MKKIIFMIVAIVAAFVGTAQSASQPLGINNSDVHLTIELGDLTTMSTLEIENKIVQLVESKIPTLQLNCTITVKGSVNVGVAEFEIEVSVTGTCDEIAKSGKKIASNILSQVTSLLKSGIK